MAHSEHFDCQPHRAEGEFLVSAEYEAGYRARVQGSDDYRAATRSWRSGWSDADHDVQRGELNNRSNAAGRSSRCGLRSGPVGMRASASCRSMQTAVMAGSETGLLADIALGVIARKGGDDTIIAESTLLSVRAYANPGQWPVRHLPQPEAAGLGVLWWAS
jgi:hypothetical protein